MRLYLFGKTDLGSVFHSLAMRVTKRDKKRLLKSGNCKRLDERCMNLVRFLTLLNTFDLS